MNRSTSRPRIARLVAAGGFALVACCLAQFPTQLKVDISPPEAVAAGAAWKLPGETPWRPAGVFQTDIPPGVHFLEYKSVPGWLAPQAGNAVSLPPQATVVVGVQYAQEPEFPLLATASEGGYLRGEEWAPVGFDHTDRPELESRRWESAVRRSGMFDFTMPPANAGRRVRIRALPFPGYRFVGWSGDVAGYRNPATLIMNRPYTVRAQFARAPGSAQTPAQSADAYSSPGTLVVHGQFSVAPGEQLVELRWRPALPPGWRLTTVSGLAGPVIQNDQIHFTGALGHNPILFNFGLEVPAGQTGPRQLGGSVEYGMVGGTNLLVRPVGTLFGLGPLVLNARPSPAARLALQLQGGQSVIEIHGEVGRTYTLQQVPEFFPDYERFWWHIRDVLLTNSPQPCVDDTTLPGRQSSGMYRAVLIE